MPITPASHCVLKKNGRRGGQARRPFILAADFEGVGSTFRERDQVSCDEVRAGVLGRFGHLGHFAHAPKVKILRFSKPTVRFRPHNRP